MEEIIIQKVISESLKTFNNEQIKKAIEESKKFKILIENNKNKIKIINDIKNIIDDNEILNNNKIILIKLILEDFYKKIQGKLIQNILDDDSLSNIEKQEKINKILNLGSCKNKTEISIITKIQEILDNNFQSENEIIRKIKHELQIELTKSITLKQKINEEIQQIQIILDDYSINSNIKQKQTINAKLQYIYGMMVVQKGECIQYPKIYAINLICVNKPNISTIPL